MKVALFYHSMISDWNHGNAHFLRGIVRELLARGNQVEVYEPEDGWSLRNLIVEQGPKAVGEFHDRFPSLQSTLYRLEDLDLDHALDQVDLVLVHEWNEPELVARLGRHRARNPGFRLLFHDTHHRAVTAPDAMAAYDLTHYDGVLAFGRVIRDLYLERGWAVRAWTWHEAADVRVFRPLADISPVRDLIWIGNWGDDERTRELDEFLLEPARSLALSGTIYGVRYPAGALEALSRTGLEYRGWIPNHAVPQAFAEHRVTVHIPRGPYASALPGIPTIRVFEALACGIPLVSAPWEDTEDLFTPGEDFLVASDREEVTSLLKEVLNDQDLAAELRRRGIATIRSKHTCAHRVDELLEIYENV